MAIVFADRIRTGTSTAGTGTLTLTTAPTGFQSPATAAIPTGSTVGYVIEDGSNWEVGIGTYTVSGTTLSRDLVEASSAAGAKITTTTSAVISLTLTANLIGELITGIAPDVALDLNFVSGVLDPRIALTRAAGGATYFDASGTLQLAQVNQPRFDWDPVTLLFRGLLMEETRTNQVRNPRAEGAVAGSPGTLPTNWSVTGAAALTQTIVGTGTESGIPYIDIEFSGTTAAANQNVLFESNTITATPSQLWSASVYLRLVAGAWPSPVNLTWLLGDNIATQQPGITTPTGAALVSQRMQATFTTNAGAVTSLVNKGIQIAMSGAGVVCDFTLRIGLPQIEAGAMTTSPILPVVGTPAAAVRAAEGAELPIGSWYNPAAGTLEAEAACEILPAPAANQGIVMLDDGGAEQNLIRIWNQGVSSSIFSQLLIAGVGSGARNINTTSGTFFKHAISWDGSTTVSAMAGLTISTSQASTTPGSITRLILGRSHPTAGQWTLNGWLRRIRYWKRALTVPEMQLMTGAGSPGIGNTALSNTPIGFPVPAPGAFSAIIIGNTLGTYLVNNLAQITALVNGWLQAGIQNMSAGTLASSDLVATANDGTETTNFIDVGINSSGYADATFTIVGAHGAYVYNLGGNVAIGTGDAHDLILFTGGTLAANERMRISSTGAITLSNGAVLPTPVSTGRNYIINAMMNVQQRGAGPFITSGAYSLDRWTQIIVLDTLSVAPGTWSDANRVSIGDEEAVNCLVATVTGNAGATAASFLVHRIENVRRLAGKTITVSFWAMAASGTPKLGVSLDQNFGSGGSPSAIVNINGPSAVTLSTTPARYSVSLNVPSIAGKTVGTTANTSYTQLDLWLSAGANSTTRAGGVGVQTATISLWGVQVEIGPMTPLEKPDPFTELSRCSRFYQSGGSVYLAGVATAASQALSYTHALSEQMRAAPSITFGTPTYTNMASLTSGAANPNSFVATANSSASGAANFQCTFTAAAEL